MSSFDLPIDTSPWGVVEPDSGRALELAAEDEEELTDEELEAMVAEIVAEDSGGGESEAEALYRQLEAMTPGPPGS